MLLDLANQEVGGLVNAALQGDRVGAGGHVAQASLHHGVRQHGGGGGAVTGSVVGLAGGLTDQGNAGVLDVVFEFDLLGDRHAIVDDLGSTKLLLQHHIAALRTEGDGDGFSQDVDTALEGTPGLFVVNDALGHGRSLGRERMKKVDRKRSAS